MYGTILGMKQRLLTAFREYGNQDAHTACDEYLFSACTELITKGFGDPEHSVLTGMFMPCELFYAFSLTPLCTEMLAVYLTGVKQNRTMIAKAEGEGISETFCSYHKIVMGAAEMDLLEGIAGIVNCSLACDANNLTYRVLSHKRSYPQYFVDVPYEKDESSVLYVMDQLKELAAALESLTASEMDMNVLQEICERSRRTAENMKRTVPYRSSRTLHQSMKSLLMETMLMKNMMGTEEALNYSESILKEWEKAEQSDASKLVWMHCNPAECSPVKSILEGSDRIRIAAMEPGMDHLYCSTAEDPFRYMAENLVYNAYNGSCYDRIEQMKRLLKGVEADGAVCFCQWGCKQTCGASGLIKEELEQAGYPVLLLNGDAADPDNSSDGQISTRLGAFAEMLGERRR